MEANGLESQCLFGLLEVILAAIGALKGMWALRGRGRKE